MVKQTFLFNSSMIILETMARKNRHLKFRSEQGKSCLHNSFQNCHLERRKLKKANHLDPGSQKCCLQFIPCLQDLFTSRLNHRIIHIKRLHRAYILAGLGVQRELIERLAVLSKIAVEWLSFFVNMKSYGD